jgi:phage I-like protein/cation transport regulator ChaB
MPYTRKNLPPSAKGLPPAAKDIFIAAFNNANKQYGDKDKAFATAWAAVRAAGYDKKGDKWVKASESFNYLVSLSDSNTSEIEMIREGKWNHPAYGELNITSEVMDDFIRNFNENVRGINLAIDIEHGETNNKTAAAGWIKKLIKKGNKLFGEIEWTELGKENIDKKIFKYFSPEFKFNYIDNETGKKHKNVLFGGALTNRPFIKKMQSVVLAEPLENEINQQTYIPLLEGDENKMNEELRKALKLSESSTEADVSAAINKLIEDSTKLGEVTTKLNEATKKLDETSKNLTDSEKKVLQLSESIKAIEANLQEAEWDKLSSKCLSEGKLVPSMVETFKAQFMADPKSTRELLDIMQPIVTLGEKGSSQGQTENSAIQLFEAEVKKAEKDLKLEYHDALVHVEKTNPKLFKDFEEQRRGI